MVMIYKLYVSLPFITIIATQTGELGSWGLGAQKLKV